MNNIERFRNAMTFQPVDRLPEIEWATWWDLTIKRWVEEGLPKDFKSVGEIRDYFGQDSQEQIYIHAIKSGAPTPEHHGAGIIKTKEDYDRIKPFLYPKENFIGPSVETVKQWAKQQEAGETVTWVSLQGFFWWPRVLLGIERHLYAFYDQPELMHEINQDICDFNIWGIEQLVKIIKPTFMTFFEDLSYNHGPMLSKRAFDTFLAPYYKQLIPVLEKYDIIPIIDSDGDITRLIPWFQGVGIRGILPLERMAGVDVNFLRDEYPDFILIGGYDKTVMKDGEAAMRKEFERLLPAMKKGGFIPSVDHQTPPGVPLENYYIYLKLLHEYCVKAAE
jgi:uroporphyrinogen-III decarboxylase